MKTTVFHCTICTVARDECGNIIVALNDGRVLIYDALMSKLITRWNCFTIKTILLSIMDSHMYTVSLYKQRLTKWNYDAKSVTLDKQIWSKPMKGAVIIDMIDINTNMIGVAIIGKILIMNRQDGSIISQLEIYFIDGLYRLSCDQIIIRTRQYKNEKWNVSPLELQKDLGYIGKHVLCSRTNKRVLMVDDLLMYMYCSETWQVIWSQPVFEVQNVCYSPQEEYIAIAEIKMDQSKIQIVCAHTGQPLSHCIIKGTIASMIFSICGRRLYIGMMEKGLHRWKIFSKYEQQLASLLFGFSSFHFHDPSLWQRYFLKQKK